MIKTSEDGVPVYEIRHAGVDKTVICEDDFEGCKFKVNNVLLALRSITTQEKAILFTLIAYTYCDNLLLPCCVTLEKSTLHCQGELYWSSG